MYIHVQCNSIHMHVYTIDTITIKREGMRGREREGEGEREGFTTLQTHTLQRISATKVYTQTLV